MLVFISNRVRVFFAHIVRVVSVTHFVNRYRAAQLVVVVRVGVVVARIHVAFFRHVERAALAHVAEWLQVQAIHHKAIQPLRRAYQVVQIQINRRSVHVVRIVIFHYGCRLIRFTDR